MHFTLITVVLALLGALQAKRTALSGNELEKALPKKITLSFFIVDFATVAFGITRCDELDDNSVDVVTTSEKHWHSSEHEVCVLNFWSFSRVAFNFCDPCHLSLQSHFFSQQLFLSQVIGNYKGWNGKAIFSVKAVKRGGVYRRKFVSHSLFQEPI